jgi:hypothetical protein
VHSTLPSVLLMKHWRASEERGRVPELSDCCHQEHGGIVSDGSEESQVRCLCTDEYAMHRPEEDIGNLRVALNALLRLFRPNL